jgi:hypothetical protein
VIYGVKLPRRLTFIKSSRATNLLTELKLADVSKTTSVPIIRASDTPETSTSCSSLTRHVAREDFIHFTNRYTVTARSGRSKRDASLQSRQSLSMCCSSRLSAILSIKNSLLRQVRSEHGIRSVGLPVAHFTANRTQPCHRACPSAARQAKGEQTLSADTKSVRPGDVAPK